MPYTPPTNVTAEKLYLAIAKFGPSGAAQLGYFNGLVSDGSSSGVQRKTPVTSSGSSIDPDKQVGEVVVSFTDLNLTQPPILSGVVLNPVANAIYSLKFIRVTKDGATLKVIQMSDGLKDDGSLHILPALNVNVAFSITATL